MWALVIEGQNEVFENGFPNGKCIDYSLPLSFTIFEDMIDFIKIIENACDVNVEYKISKV